MSLKVTNYLLFKVLGGNVEVSRLHEGVSWKAVIGLISSVGCPYYEDK